MYKNQNNEKNIFDSSFHGIMDGWVDQKRNRAYPSCLFEVWKEIYENFYGIPLEYTTESDKENVNV